MTRKAQLVALAMLVLGFSGAWSIQELRIEQMRRDRETVKEVEAIRVIYEAEMKRIYGAYGE